MLMASRRVICPFVLFLFASGILCGCAHLMPPKGANKAATDKVKNIKAKFVKASDYKEDEWLLDNYLIDMGDILEISVWQVEELQREVVVRPDGKISFPLIGDLPAAGKTIDQLRQDIVERIKLYIKIPQISVNIIEFGGKKAVVIGDVGDEGVIRFNTPTRVIEAIALAGGFDKLKANLDKIYVIRDVHEAQPVVIMVNANNILKNGVTKENVFVHSGDIIYATRAMSQDFNQFMDNVFGRVVSYAETYYGDTWRRRYGGTPKAWKYKTQGRGE
jgi:polysaccharide export outer membrane protein